MRRRSRVRPHRAPSRPPRNAFATDAGCPFPRATTLAIDACGVGRIRTTSVSVDARCPSVPNGRASLCPRNADRSSAACDTLRRCPRLPLRGRLGLSVRRAAVACAEGAGLGSEPRLRSRRTSRFRRVEGERRWRGRRASTGGSAWSRRGAPAADCWTPSGAESGSSSASRRRLEVHCQEGYAAVAPDGPQPERVGQTAQEDGGPSDGYAATHAHAATRRCAMPRSGACFLAADDGGQQQSMKGDRSESPGEGDESSRGERRAALTEHPWWCGGPQRPLVCQVPLKKTDIGARIEDRIRGRPG